MAYEQYTYDGPVVEFDRVICNHWSGTTYAPSLQKARTNLAYQFRKQFGKETRTRISLPGKIQKV